MLGNGDPKGSLAVFQEVGIIVCQTFGLGAGGSVRLSGGSVGSSGNVCLRPDVEVATWYNNGRRWLFADNTGIYTCLRVLGSQSHHDVI
jgi:hypothetical protein